MKYIKALFNVENYWVTGNHPVTQELFTHSFIFREAAIQAAREAKTGGFWRIKEKKS